jgi:hypothetical protein
VTGLSVHTVRADLERFRSLLLDLPEEEFGSPRSRLDAAPPVYIDNFDAPSPDVWQLTSMGNIFVVTPNVIEKLEPFLSLAGELVALRNATNEAWEFRALRITNLFNLEDCVDVSFGHVERMRLLKESLKSATREEAELVTARVAAGDPFPFLAPAFRVKCFTEAPATLFQLDRLRGTVFLLDRDDRSDTMLRRIEQLNISGLQLDCVWSSESGPRGTNLFRR